jgi:hypothetical protein
MVSLCDVNVLMLYQCNAELTQEKGSSPRKPGPSELNAQPNKLNTVQHNTIRSIKCATVQTIRCKLLTVEACIHPTAAHIGFMMDKAEVDSFS